MFGGVAGGSIPSRFEQSVALYPDRIAVQTVSRCLTYRQLNQWANQVARLLLDDRGGCHEQVATLLDSDAPLVAAFLGILKAGKCYVPVDTSLPDDRARFLLDDSQARVLLTDSSHLERARSLGLPILLVGSLAPSLPNPGLDPDPFSHTWILYTSGSTGQPKGVLQNHRNLLEYVRHYQEAFLLRPEDRLSTLYSLTINGGMHDLLMALLSGASLHPWNARRDGLAGLRGWLHASGSTIYSSAASVWRQFAQGLPPKETFPDLRFLRLWAEPCRPNDYEAFQRHTTGDAVFVNRLGATELGSVCWKFIHRREKLETAFVPLGSAVQGHEILLWDEHCRQVPAGETGEIVIRSELLSPGYWNRPEANRQAFLPDPEDGSRRLYRTGDLGRRLPDGELVHMGRKDHQVKVRGYRVELPEIERALLGYPGVRDAVVLGRPDPAGGTRLVAYLLSRSEICPKASELRRFLAARLASHMIPSAFAVLDEFPSAQNGKVLRGALPDPGTARPDIETVYEAPEGTIESEIAAIWSEVLAIDTIGRNDEFLDVGGNSLLAMQVLARVSSRFNVDLPPSQVLAAGTVSAMAAALMNARAGDVDRLLREVELLSEEEAARLLGRIGS